MATKPNRTQALCVAAWLVSSITAPSGSRPFAAAAETVADSGSETPNAPQSVYLRQRELSRQAAELRRKTRDILQREARAEGPERLPAALDLVDLYIELRLDPSLPDLQRRELCGKVRSRLIRVKDDLAQSRKETAATDQDSLGLQLARRTARQTVQSVVGVSPMVLAQQGVAGPAGVLGGAALGGPLLPNDYGPDLVELIQTVIAPATWERNGGPGSIYYYRPLKVLVIRQTGEVHDQIGDTVEALRRAGN